VRRPRYDRDDRYDFGRRRDRQEVAVGSSTAHDLEGTELFLQEIRDEAHKLLHHPIQEVGRLEHVAAEGESAATPIIVFIGVGLVLLALFAVFCALAVGVYYWT
jgi:hypothetical protein